MSRVRRHISEAVQPRRYARRVTDCGPNEGATYLLGAAQSAPTCVCCALNSALHMRRRACGRRRTGRFPKAP